MNVYSVPIEGIATISGLAYVSARNAQEAIHKILEEEYGGIDDETIISGLTEIKITGVAKYAGDDGCGDD